jgi:hypothetical protein
VPSLHHDAVLWLLEQRPSLAVSLLRRLHVALPDFSTVELVSADLTQLIPTEFRADALLILRDAERRPVLGIVFESQGTPDPDKLLSWPVYVTAARARHGCPFLLLVIASTDRVARWARRPISVGPRAVVQPFVLTPRDIPTVPDAAFVVAEPELAALAAMVHGRDTSRGSIALVRTVLETLSRRGGAPALQYCEAIWNQIAPGVRAALEEFMYTLNLPLKSPLRIRLERSLAEGLEKGMQQGMQQGMQKGEAQALLLVLETRGLPIPEAARARILACDDTALLATWIQRAVTATSLDDVFAAR